MAVLVTADVPGQTQEGYDRMIATLTPALQEAKGFIAHGAAPAGEGASAAKSVSARGPAGRLMPEAPGAEFQPVAASGTSP